MDDAELVRRYLELRRRERAGGGPYRGFLDANDMWRLYDLWDAALLRFIQRRYACNSDATQELFRRWKEEEADGVMLGAPWFNDDGEVRLSAGIGDMFDRWAAELGLTPR